MGRNWKKKTNTPPCRSHGAARAEPRIPAAAATPFHSAPRRRQGASLGEARAAPAPAPVGSSSLWCVVLARARASCGGCACAWRGSAVCGVASTAVRGGVAAACSGAAASPGCVDLAAKWHATLPAGCDREVSRWQIWFWRLLRLRRWGPGGWRRWSPGGADVPWRRIWSRTTDQCSAPSSGRGPWELVGARLLLLVHEEELPPPHGGWLADASSGGLVAPRRCFSGRARRRGAASSSRRPAGQRVAPPRPRLLCVVSGAVSASTPTSSAMLLPT